MSCRRDETESRVFVVSCKALKKHGGVKEKELSAVGVRALKRGFENVQCHLNGLAKFGIPVVVAINRFPGDDCGELDAVFDLCRDEGCEAALSEVAAFGAKEDSNLPRKSLLFCMHRESRHPYFAYCREERACSRKDRDHRQGDLPRRGEHSAARTPSFG